MATIPDINVVPEIDWREFESELISINPWSQPATIAAIVTAVATTAIAVLLFMKGR